MPEGIRQTNTFNGEYIMLLKLSSALIATVFASSALADQCTLVDADVAKKASGYLQNLQGAELSYVEYISTIEENQPSEEMLVTSTTAKADDFGGQYIIYINDKPVDLAYTFVPNENGEYVNLGLLAGCTTCVACVDKLP